MAALRPPCPSAGGLVVGAATTTPRPSIGSTSRVRVLGRQSTSSLLKTSSGGVGSWTTTAAGLHHRYQLMIRAHNGDWPAMSPDPADDDKPMTEEEFTKFRGKLKEQSELDKDMPFRKDVERIGEYWKKMTSWNTSIFHMRATQLSLHLCFVAKSGVKMASMIMDCAVSTLDEQDEISLDTTKQTLGTYVSIFVKLAEDTYHQKFHVESMFSLLGAFRGVAAVGHILLQGALARVEYAEDISSTYNFVHGMADSWDEFDQELKKLEDKFRDVSESPQSYKLLRPTMEDAMVLTLFFVLKMVGGCNVVLRKLSGHKRRRAKDLSADEDADAAETGSEST